MAQTISGTKLAEAAHMLLMHRDRYRSGIEIDELVKLLESSGITVAGDDRWSTLRSALNQAQTMRSFACKALLRARMRITLRYRERMAWSLDFSTHDSNVLSRSRNSGQGNTRWRSGSRSRRS